MRGIAFWLNVGTQLSRHFYTRTYCQPLLQRNLFSGNGSLTETATYNLRFIHVGIKRTADSSQSVAESSRLSDTPVLDSLRERGLYYSDLYKHYSGLKIETSHISPDGKTATINWNDGHKSGFDAIWLRHFCHCPHCKLDHNGMIQVDFLEVDLDIVISSMQMEGEDIVIFKWKSNGDEKEHTGYIPTCYLRIHCYSAEALSQRSNERSMKFYEEKVIPEFDFKDISASESGLYKWISALSDKGVCLLKNVPTEPYYVKKVAELIAPIQHTIYGETFDVKSVKRPVNAAYSDVKLYPHMDQPNYESPPGIQFLHCIKFDEAISGGENTFLDIHEVAEKFRQEQPDLFAALARIPYTAQMVNYRSDFSYHLQIQRPIFVLNHRHELVSVNWHPMIFGATQVAKEDVLIFYKAYITFFKMVNQYKSQYELRLRPGDLISFNNRRLLHSRNAFKSELGDRHLQGTYVEISEFQSLAQVLHNRYGQGRLAARSGSNDWF